MIVAMMMMMIGFGAGLRLCLGLALESTAASCALGWRQGDLRLCYGTLIIFDVTSTCLTQGSTFGAHTARKLTSS